jgi:hypothetical protein
MEAIEETVMEGDDYTVRELGVDSDDRMDMYGNER